MIPLGIRRRTGAGRRGLLADIDQRPTMNIIAEEICGIRWRLLQRDFSGRLLVVALRQKLGQTLPDGVAFSGRHHHRIHPLQTHIAQNKRHHGGRQIEAPGQTAGGDAAAILRLRQHFGQHWAANGIHRARPQLFLQRAGLCEVAARQDRIGAQLAKVIMCRFPARYGRHPVAKGFEQHHGGAADPAAGAGDQDIPAIRGDTRTNESINA
mgnify:CR=1 FL=1